MEVTLFCVWMYGLDEVDGHICMYTARNCFDTILFMVCSFVCPLHL